MIRAFLVTTIVALWPQTFTAQSDIPFTDITTEAGIRFSHNSGATGQKYLPETLGAGGLFIDIDSNGWQDIFLVNSANWESSDGRSFPALYRNDGDGTFTDITSGSGLEGELYGIGGSAADFDNDGNTDIYVTALGPNRLFRGHGDGTFTDVTQATGKTDVGKQWAVGREMNRRIKKRFDEEGIEIPFPHRTVFLADSSRTPPLLLDDSARAEIRQIIREEIANAATR